jgi:hypothetical protein
MPKKIKFESFKNHLLIHAANTSLIVDKNKWKKFIKNLNFKYEGKDFVILSKDNKELILRFNINNAKLYVRGDLGNISNSFEDNVKIHNKEVFNTIVKIIALEAKFL